MSKEMEQKTTSADAGISSAAFIEAKINRLKGRLEATLARTHNPAHLEGMIEDCEIILDHFESISPKAGKANGVPAIYSGASSKEVVREWVNP